MSTCCHMEEKNHLKLSPRGEHSSYHKCEYNDYVDAFWESEVFHRYLLVWYLSRTSVRRNLLCLSPLLGPIWRLVTNDYQYHDVYTWFKVSFGRQSLCVHPILPEELKVLGLGHKEVWNLWSPQEEISLALVHLSVQDNELKLLENSLTRTTIRLQHNNIQTT